MSHREDTQNLLSLKGILHTDEGPVGDEPNFRSLRDGRRYVTSKDADGIRDVTFQTIVRYLDYIPKDKVFIIERLPMQGSWRPARGPTQDDTVLDVAWDLLLALALLHATGTVHGDVRLHNIFPFPSEDSSRVRFKLFGHGLVPEVINHQLRNDGFTAPGLRSPGKWYDLSTNRKPTFESDIWMLGMVLWHVHRFGVNYDGRGSARQRWESDRMDQPDLTDGAKYGINPLPTRPRGCEPSPHRFVEDLLHKMLIPDPKQRWTAADLLEQMKLQKRYTPAEDDMKRDLADLQAALKGEKYDTFRRMVAMLEGVPRRSWTRLGGYIFLFAFFCVLL
ncbi:kinase-like domain-containing protein [Colletotrichum phormii]|uniref:non-specific serine/threonine protein kinase n=1 Tax=Colletotrichum phormii TaxID=359342 RepID=A0AAI9ZQI8_9PEZI|nr:kinase-like domain-containing protein [Colletotrichum phormii]KAK1634877.1 kinase-like domain-containing protein [Colletotrichum phormii]